MSLIIPAIDLIEGKCVRLEKGDYAKKKIYNADPFEVAQSFEDKAISHLHLVDLDGAKEGRVINWKVLEKICSKTTLQVDFGGGIKSDEDLRIAFECGAKQVNIGSLAAKDPETFHRWLQELGPERIILSADSQDGKVAISGWQEGTGRHLFDFIHEHQEAGVKYVTCTDIAKDGMLEGPATGLYRELKAEFPELKLIASGGVTNMKDVDDLREIGVYGIIIGKAIYEGRITLEELVN